jgi:hypothetical protein
LVTPAALSAFKSNPDALLAQYPMGSGGLTGEIRNLVASDPSLASVILSLVKRANPTQKSAMAAGLAQAALTCSERDPTLALRIQEAVAAFDDASFQTAFAEASRDTRTTAVGAGGDGAQASSGGTGPTGNLSAQGSGNNGRDVVLTGTPQQGFTLFVPGGGGSSFGTTSTTSVTNQISPTR